MGYLHEKRKKTKSFSNQWRWKQIVRFQSAGAMKFLIRRGMNACSCFPRYQNNVIQFDDKTEKITLNVQF